MLCAGLLCNNYEFFLLGLHFLTNLYFWKHLSASTHIQPSPGQKELWTKVWHTSFEGSSWIPHWTWFSSPVCCCWYWEQRETLHGNSRKAALCPSSLRRSCHTPWKGTVIYEEWFSVSIFIGWSTAEYNPSLILDFTAWVYLYHFGRLQWLLHFHFIMMNYLKSFLLEQIPPALTPARIFHFVLKIAVENFLQPLICQRRVYYYSQSRHTGTVWKVL